MKRLITFLLMLLAFTVAVRSQAAETCTPAQLQHVDSRDAHGLMCFDTARILVQLVRDSGLDCDMVVGSIMDPANHKYFVTCRVLDVTRRADRAELYINYRSVDGRAFEAAP